MPGAESQIRASVLTWFSEKGYLTRREIQVPWIRGPSSRQRKVDVVAAKVVRGRQLLTFGRPKDLFDLVDVLFALPTRRKGCKVGTIQRSIRDDYERRGFRKSISLTRIRKALKELSNMGFVEKVGGTRWRRKKGSLKTPTKELVIVEAKTRNLEAVISQAESVRRCCDKLYIALSKERAESMSGTERELLRSRGINVISVDVYTGNVKEEIKLRRRRARDHKALYGTAHLLHKAGLGWEALG